MSESKEPKTQKYEVTRKGCLSFDVGDIVELTDAKAKSLVNKVKPFVKPKDQVKKVESKKAKSQDGGKDI